MSRTAFGVGRRLRFVQNVLDKFARTSKTDIAIIVNAGIARAKAGACVQA
jgi:hypothetical protein